MFAFAIFLLRVYVPFSFVLSMRVLLMLYVHVANRNTLWRNSIIWSLTALSLVALMTAIGLGAWSRGFLVRNRRFTPSVLLELFRIDEAYIGDSHVALVSISK